VDDVDAALRKGDLKLSLNGYKLKGSWVLVRTKSGDGRPSTGSGRPEPVEGRSWLLIKHRDEWSGPIDIAELAPLSVNSSGDFEDILAADTPASWTSNRPARGGHTGAMLNEIIEKAATIRSGRGPKPSTAQKNKPAKRKASTQRAQRPKTTNPRPPRPLR
jgi:bifunctional non-homologous end joining protein LigD